MIWRDDIQRVVMEGWLQTVPDRMTWKTPEEAYIQDRINIGEKEEVHFIFLQKISTAFDWLKCHAGYSLRGTCQST